MGHRACVPCVGTGRVNNRPIKTVYAATVKPRIARNLRLNVIYSTREAPLPGNRSPISTSSDGYARVKLDHVRGKFVFSLNFNADGLIIFVKRGSSVNWFWREGSSVL